MKRSLIGLIISVLLLGFGWLVPHSVFDVTLETSTPSSSPSSVSSPPETVAVNLNGSTPMPAPTEEHDPIASCISALLNPRNMPRLLHLRPEWTSP
jgi:hypothetical protein